MEKIFSNDQFEHAVEVNNLLLAYFSGNNCNVCASLKPKIEMLTSLQFPTVKLVEIPTEESPELTTRFRVYSVPVILLFVEGREYIREAGIISTTELAQKMDKIIKMYEE